MMKRIWLIVVMCLSMAGIARAQGMSEWQLSVNYNIGIPLGDFGDFISPGSFRGGNLEVDYFLNEKFSVGGIIGWNGFYERKNNQTYMFDGGAISGTRYNYFYALPIMLKAQYFFVDAGQILPYAGLGVGTVYTEHETYMGFIGFATEKWKFGLAPELGLHMGLGQSGWAFKVAGRYNAIFYNENNLNTVDYLGVNLGFNYDF
ncbi:outer membrane beta-barrel protein [bacterium SCSIO 12741]|nr:outer membrane beta-barrel protein [bacterium SCSIO 12741]